MIIKRNTVQCALVLEAVNKLKNHATADEIYECLIKDYPHIGKATVYRNLQRLSELGQIRKIEVPDGSCRYDHICHNHYHIRCTECGKVFDIDLPYIKELENYANNISNFKNVQHDIMFKGICTDCQNKK